MPNDIYDYDKYLTPDYLIKGDENKEEIDDSKNGFKLII